MQNKEELVQGGRNELLWRGQNATCLTSLHLPWGPSGFPSSAGTAAGTLLALFPGGVGRLWTPEVFSVKWAREEPCDDPAGGVLGFPGWLTHGPLSTQVLAAEENVDFRIHVENQTRARDDVSRKQLRLYQLYSRTSGKHIQVLGRRISARGEDGDKYGRCPLTCSPGPLPPQCLPWFIGPSLP